MIMFGLGYGSREMNMAFTNAKNRCLEAYVDFEKELEQVTEGHSPNIKQE